MSFRLNFCWTQVNDLDFCSSGLPSFSCPSALFLGLTATWPSAIILMIFGSYVSLRLCYVNIRCWDDWVFNSPPLVWNFSTPTRDRPWVGLTVSNPGVKKKEKKEGWGQGKTGLRHAWWKTTRGHSFKSSPSLLLFKDWEKMCNKRIEEREKRNHYQRNSSFSSRWTEGKSKRGVE